MLKKNIIYSSLFTVMHTKIRDCLSMTKKLFTQSAFTLAETLVVIGIIGVVATLTLPNLNNSTGDQEIVAKTKKLYSNLNDAFGRAVINYGPVKNWFKNDSCTATWGGAVQNKPCGKRVGERLIDYLKISKNCEFSTGCFTNADSKNLDGSSDGNIDTNNSYYKFILGDGTSIAISFVTKSGAYNGNIDKSYYALIKVDIDGPNKGPNIRAKDILGFYLTDKGILPEGYAKSNQELSQNCFSKGWGCASNWIIENGNRDYLKANSSGTCPDGKTVLNWTTNTSCK